ncbi:pentatricopeptide repeat-containing protein At3g49710-like [Zingiber officinale]|uniref:pentatricopeptide repeat-containing protein At3g49710-like n=1 Tax=Zingiber officinale TaxID=94328 RepID=UPI001C4B57BD|nr:pentatricopeptide repeat-containing protein At3g49710-like [Zingiber officinale]
MKILKIMNVLSLKVILSSSSFPRYGSFFSSLWLYLGSDADGFTLSSLMSSIVNVIEQFHSLTMALGLEYSYVFVNNTLNSSYSKGDFLVEVEPVFDEMFCKRDVVSWNCMIAAFGQHRQGLKALTYFRGEAICRDQRSSLCERRVWLERCATWAVAEKSYNLQFKLANMLATFMGRKDSVGGAQFHIVDAMKVFKEVDDPDLVMWNTVISGKVDEGWEYFDSMRQKYDIEPEEEHYSYMVYLLAYIVKSPGDDDKIKIFGDPIYDDEEDENEGHGYKLYFTNLLKFYFGIFLLLLVVQSDTEATFQLATTLLPAFATANGGTYASPTWTKSLNLFQVLVKKCFKIDMLKVANMFTTCMVMKDSVDGAQFHVHMTKNDFARKSHFDSDLIDLYLKVSWTVDAMKVFKEVDDHDLVVWNTMISGYLLNDEFSEQGLKCCCDT